MVKQLWKWIWNIVKPTAEAGGQRWLERFSINGVFLRILKNFIEKTRNRENPYPGIFYAVSNSVRHMGKGIQDWTK